MLTCLNFQRLFGRTSRWTSPLQLLNLVLISLRMKLKYKGCLRWEFCKSVKNALMRFVETLPPGLSTTGELSNTEMDSRCGCVEAVLLPESLQT